jgi:hypothetical protein
LGSARLLLVFSGMTTLALNAAEPVSRGEYGRAAFDAVGPLALRCASWLDWWPVSA